MLWPSKLLLKLAPPGEAWSGPTSAARPAGLPPQPPPPHLSERPPQRDASGPAGGDDHDDAAGFEAAAPPRVGAQADRPHRRAPRRSGQAAVRGLTENGSPEAVAALKRCAVGDDLDRREWAITALVESLHQPLQLEWIGPVREAMNAALDHLNEIRAELWAAAVASGV